MPFNGKTLKPAEKSYLIASIKAGNTKTKCIEMLISKFGRNIDMRNLSRFARINKLNFKKYVDELAYSAREISILKGLWLVNAGPKRRVEAIPHRSSHSMDKKISELKYTKTVEEDLRTKIKNDITKKIPIKRIEKKYGVPRQYVAEFKKSIDESVVQIENLKRWEDADVDRALDQIERSQEALRKLESDQPNADITISTQNKYVALMFLSDIHLENVNTDTNQLRKDIEIIRNTKDFYVGFGGDLIDNFIVGPHKEGVIEAVIPPKAARIVAGKLFDKLKGRLLWSIIGCHDAWDRDYADYNLPEHIARKMKIPYLGHGGDINLSLKRNGGKPVEYMMHARHKYKGGSSNDGTGVCKNVLRSIDAKFDIVAISHNHFAQIKIEDFMRKERVFIRTGSYKKEDRFSKKLGFESSEFNSKIPVVLLNTETKKMMIFSGVSAAAEALKALNRPR